MKKVDEYAIKIVAQLQEMFDEDCENYINPEELMEGKNATHFTHALASLAPAIVVGSLTGDKQNALEFNHMANILCMQYGNFSSK